MPRFRTILEFIAANPPGRSVPLSGTRKAWHRLFCYYQSQYSAENFACWVAMHQYKQHQRKRFAVFISENWINKPANAQHAVSTTQSIFDTINFSSALNESQAGTLVKVSWMKMVMTRSDKADFTKDQISFLGATPPELFDPLFNELTSLMTGMIKDTFDSDRDFMPSGSYQTTLPGDLAMMQAAGFDIHQYGMW